MWINPEKSPRVCGQPGARHDRLVSWIPQRPFPNCVVRPQPVVVVGIRHRKGEPRREMGRVEIDGMLERLDGFGLALVFLLFHAKLEPRGCVSRISLHSSFQLQNALPKKENRTKH